MLPKAPKVSTSFVLSAVDLNSHYFHIIGGDQGEDQGQVVTMDFFDPNNH